MLAAMANFWARGGHEVTLITLSTREDFYPVHNSVKRIGLDLLSPSTNRVRALYNLGRRVLKLRKAIQGSGADRVLSFIDKTNVLTLLACVGLGLPVIVSERTNPLEYSIPWAWSRLRDVMYRRASAIVVQTERLRKWATNRSTPGRVHVINNAIDEARLATIARANALQPHACGQPRIITMGRLTREKGHDLLLAACAEVLAAYPSWRLEIVGDGPLRAQLQAQATKLGISEKVIFHGQLPAPFTTLQSAEIFVLPSRVEGFPNVLLEAMSLRRACVSFDCEFGPSELIEHGVNGLLVPPRDVAELAAAICRLIEDPAIRRRLGEQAGSVMDRYSESRIMSQWAEVMAL